MPDSPPKLFISYSWSSEDHIQWVVTLAEQLRENGIDVILDKWDLKEGQDTNVFMEKMVTDSEIKKVILVCDRMYADKADGRSGGVGKETQIISPEIYSKTDQTKFVAVISERNEKTGEPFLPTYYKSRIYIDLSDSETYAQNFEQLLRWAYDKPLYIKPAVGKPPAFLVDESAPSLETTFRFQRTVDAIRQSKPYFVGALNEYCDTFADNLEKFRLSSGGTNDFDDKVIQSIEQFLPFRNEAIELFSTLAQYRPTQEVWEIQHRFFERLITYLDRPEAATGVSWEWDYDNFKFIVHELFLYANAMLLKYERFEGVGYLLRHCYFDEYAARRTGKELVSFLAFSNRLRSLAHRNDRLELRRLSLHADILKQRAEASGYRFEQLMQADYVLYLRSCLDSLRIGAEGWSWWPETLVYATLDSPRIFEIFARSQSTQYFNKILPMFDISGKNDLAALLQAFRKGIFTVPSWQFDRIDVFNLMNHERLATTP